MFKHYKKHIDVKSVSHLVKLSPTAVSAYSRTQTQPDRVCTIEAIAILMRMLGEPQGVCEQLVLQSEDDNSLSEI